MIGVNYLKTKVLITVDEVVFHAPVDSQVDVRMINQNIILAERRFIKPILGSVIYGKLVEAKNKLVTEANLADSQTEVEVGRPDDRDPVQLHPGDYLNSDTYLNSVDQELWNSYLHKIVAEAVWFTALPVNRSRFTASGIVNNFPENVLSAGGSQTIQLRDLKHLMDKGLQDRVSVLIDDMHSFLCLTAYPGYKRDCGCDGQGQTKKTDVILGMYDEDYPCGCGRKKREDEY